MEIPRCALPSRLEKRGSLFVYDIVALGVRIELRNVTLHHDGRLTASLRIYDDGSGERLPVSGVYDLADLRTREALAKALEELFPVQVWMTELDQLYCELEDMLWVSDPPRPF